MVVHNLKTWPEFFEAIMTGDKTFELRRDDRGFAVGDLLHLEEWDPSSETYTGRSITKKVNYLLEHRATAGCAATFGLMPGYVILAITSPDR